MCCRIVCHFFGSRCRRVDPAHGVRLWVGHGWVCGQWGVLQTFGGFIANILVYNP